jgi:hypothetical protein
MPESMKFLIRITSKSNLCLLWRPVVFGRWARTVRRCAISIRSTSSGGPRLATAVSSRGLRCRHDHVERANEFSHDRRKDQALIVDELQRRQRGSRRIRVRPRLLRAASTVMSLSAEIDVVAHADLAAADVDAGVAPAAGGGDVDVAAGLHARAGRGVAALGLVAPPYLRSYPSFRFFAQSASNLRPH